MLQQMSSSTSWAVWRDFSKHLATACSARSTANSVVPAMCRELMPDQRSKGRRRRRLQPSSTVLVDISIAGRYVPTLSITDLIIVALALLRSMFSGCFAK
jgi:hypothetical protein